MEHKILYYLDKIKRIQEGEFVPPVTCEIDTSNLCPLDCSFCMYKKYIKASRAVMSMDVYLRLVYELKRLGTRSITFTGGGEPLTNPNFNTFVEIASELGFELGLITNGVYLDKVSDLEAFKFIRVSLDASDSQTYEKVKGVDLFDKVIKNIKHAVKLNDTVGISYVVGPDNDERLEYAQQLANDLGVRYIQFKPASINREIFKFKLPEEDDKTIHTPRYKMNERLPCQIAQLIGIVTADGGVYYCCQHRGELSFYMGSLSQESFETLWRRRFEFKNFHIKQCPSCRYMNYAKYYKNLMKEGDLFVDHRNFL